MAKTSFLSKSPCSSNLLPLPERLSLHSRALSSSHSPGLLGFPRKLPRMLETTMGPSAWALGQGHPGDPGLVASSVGRVVASVSELGDMPWMPWA